MLYVTNTDANNQARFEGPGASAAARCRATSPKMRITVIIGPAVSPRHLNKHIDYSKLAGAIPASTRRPGSTAFPRRPTWRSRRDGATLYVAAFGSEQDRRASTPRRWRRTPSTRRMASADYISRERRRPERPRARRGPQPPLRADPLRQRGEGRSTSATRERSRERRAAQPRARSRRRRAARCSTMRPSPRRNGEASCSSCHIFGDKDDSPGTSAIPDDAVTTNPIPINLGDRCRSARRSVVQRDHAELNGINGTVNRSFHPMKGPMTTQTLRGSPHAGAMHWRGDRPTASSASMRVPTRTCRFNNFLVAFPGLLGRAVRSPTARRCSASPTSRSRCSCRPIRSAIWTTR